MEFSSDWELDVVICAHTARCQSRLVELDQRLLRLELRVLGRDADDVSDAIDELYALDGGVARLLGDHGFAYARLKGGAGSFADLRVGVARVRHALEVVGGVG